jgi:predicted RNase H-like nuclease (RuvC/YqgF family)
MTDIVEQLRKSSRGLSTKKPHEYSLAMAIGVCLEAAAEIERLRAIINAECEQKYRLVAENLDLQGEIERLRKTVDDMEAEYNEIGNWKQREIERLRAENQRLKEDVAVYRGIIERL